MIHILRLYIIMQSGDCKNQTPYDDILSRQKYMQL